MMKIAQRRLRPFCPFGPFRPFACAVFGVGRVAFGHRVKFADAGRLGQQPGRLRYPDKGTPSAFNLRPSLRRQWVTSTPAARQRSGSILVLSVPGATLGVFARLALVITSGTTLDGHLTFLAVPLERRDLLIQV